MTRWQNKAQDLWPYTRGRAIKGKAPPPSDTEFAFLTELHVYPQRPNTRAFQNNILPVLSAPNLVRILPERQLQRKFPKLDNISWSYALNRYLNFAGLQ